MPFPLETDRPILRYFRDSDMEEFLAYRSDPQVERYQSYCIPYEQATGWAVPDEMKNALSVALDKWFQAAIELKAPRALLGDFAFHVMVNDARQINIGNALAHPYWGRVYGVEASRRSRGYLFGELNLHCVVVKSDVKNIASFALLQRFGFRYEPHRVKSIWFKGAWGSEFHFAVLE